MLCPDNPFCKSSSLLENGTVHYTSNDKVTSDHVLELLDYCLSLNRYVHINTGTAGREDGSTNNWISNKVLQELLEDKIARYDWTKEQYVFQKIDPLKRIEQHEQPFSITFVKAGTEPEYPEHCDVIDCWDFSEATPRCPKEIENNLNYFEDITADIWS